MACNASHADFASPAAEITTVGMFLANLRRFKLGCGLSQFGEEKSSITSEGAAARIRRNRHVRTARFRDASSFAVSPIFVTEHTGSSATESSCVHTVSPGSS